MRPQFGPAAVVLIAHGVFVADVARDTGLSKDYVSRQLLGKRPLRPDVLTAIERLAGTDAAREVALLVGADDREVTSPSGRRARNACRSRFERDDEGSP